MHRELRECIWIILAYKKYPTHKAKQESTKSKVITEHHVRNIIDLG